MSELGNSHMNNPKPILSKDKQSIPVSAIRDHNRVGICITGVNPNDKHVNCPDKLSCPGVRMFVNPHNKNQYLCPRCGETLDIQEATYVRDGIKAVHSQETNNTFIISQNNKKVRTPEELDNLQEIDDDLKPILGESATLIEQWES